ncbi:MAG: hypothetical protein ACJ8HI_07900 [Massilia sp.]
MPDGTAQTSQRLADAVRGMHASQAGRTDKRTAKVIYQAQALRRAFGRSAAHTFLIAKRVPADLSRRVLALPDQQLRR